MILRTCWFVVFLCVCTISIHVEANDEYIQSQIYTAFPSVKSCYRLMHRHGQIGCSTPPSGLIGTLRLVNTQALLKTLVNFPPDYMVAALLSIDLFNQENIQQLKKVRLAGILILKSPPPATGWSPSVFNPPAYFSTDHIELPEPEPHDGFKWNPLGNGMSYEEFPFGIVTLQEDHSTFLLSRATWNEQKISNGEHPAQTVQFSYRMYGEINSYQCLNDSKCLPVGGYSVWSPFLGPLNKNTSTPRPIVMAVAPMDASGFFHEIAYGAESVATGLSAMLGAAAVLGNVRNISTYLNSSIIFAAFTDEAWSQSGSRKFVQDITNFKCEHFFPSTSNTACMQPYAPSLNFTLFNVSNITRIIELNQIGLNTTVFMHRSNDNNPATDALVQDLVDTTGNMSGSGLLIAPASSVPGRLPPSSTQAFVAVNPNLAAIVLTDHEREYANKYYHSHFDDASTVPSTKGYNHLCNVATLLARTLWLSAGGNMSMAITLNADCLLIQQLFHCLSQDMQCDLVRQYTIAGGGTPPTHYAGVYQLEQRKYVGGTARFIYQFLGAYSQNSTIEQTTGYAYFHDAVDPAFKFDYDAGMWKVDETINNTMLWTESNWDTNVGIRLFMTESPSMEIGMILAGIGVFILTAGFLWKSKQWCAFHYKAI